MMTGTNLSDLQLQQIVDKTVIALDKDSDGKISFEEFKTLVKARSTVAKMSFDMSKVWITNSHAVEAYNQWKIMLEKVNMYWLKCIFEKVYHFSFLFLRASDKRSGL